MLKVINIINYGKLGPVESLFLNQDPLDKSSSNYLFPGLNIPISHSIQIIFFLGLTFSTINAYLEG